MEPTFLGTTSFREDKRPIGIKQSDRLAHMAVIGKTGTGKTTMLMNMMRQDIANGVGFIFLDPHGDAVEKLAEEHKDNDRIIYFDATNPETPYWYNPIRPTTAIKSSLAASGMLEVFRNLWDESWGVRMEHIFRNCLLTLYEQPSADLRNVLDLFSNKMYREQAVRRITNETVKEFWMREFNKYNQRYRADAMAPIQNKVGAFLAHPIINALLTGEGKQPENNLSLRRLMDTSKVLLVNLSKGKLGEDASRLIGGLLINSVGLAAYSRADITEGKRVPFMLYADEFQNFTTLSLVNMASELRKYKVGMTLAHQYREQLDVDISRAVIGNVGTLICFRLGANDAVYYEKEFLPVFERQDLLNMPNYMMYLKLMINGRPTRPFSGETSVYDVG